MKLLILAVGQKMPAWAETATDDYVKRFPPDCRLEVKPVKAEPRQQGKTVEAMMAAEAERLTAALPKGGVRRVVLDERGQALTTKQLAERLTAWQLDGRDVAFFIGGPDGLDAALKQQADEQIRLSSLTLPHAMVRVMLAEALYRAWTLNVGHPYHRE